MLSSLVAVDWNALQFTEPIFVKNKNYLNKFENNNWTHWFNTKH